MPDLDPFDLGDPAEGGPTPSFDIAADADDDQARAAARAIEPGLRFTWGPPGTGKTKVLAMAVADAARRGDRVLVLAHANAAVDVAIDRIADELAGDELLTEGRVLRVGTPQLGNVRDRWEVLPERLAAQQQPGLVSRRDQLDEQRRHLSQQLRSASGADEERQLTATLRAVRAESETIAQELRDAARALVGDAQVVATTLSKAVVDQQIWSWPSTVVIVDEASMAGLPFILALALRGADTLSCFGDFRQLPPIAISKRDDAQRWFARDVFEMAGVIRSARTW